MPQRRSLFILCLLAAGSIAGCSGSVTPPKTAPVRGAVTFKGKPATGIVVKFNPQFDIGRVKFTPSGETGPDGKFTLSTGAPGNGAPPGEYVVTFEKPRVVSDRKNSGIETEVDDLKGKFSDAGQSKWKVTVQKGENHVPTFDLE